MYPVLRITEGKNESEVVEMILYKINSLYGNYRIIVTLRTFVRKHGDEVFLYLKNPEVEKTSDLAEKHFSIQSWLFKYRSRRKKGC